RFGERTTHFNIPQNEKRKYILVYEGQETEVQYFQGVIDNRLEIGIPPIIDLLPFLRSIPQESHSHPNRILSLIEEHIENYDSAKVLIDKVIDYCSENSFIDNCGSYTLKSLEEDIKCCLDEKCHLSLTDKISDKKSVIAKLVEYIENRLDLTSQIEDIFNYIEDQQILYIKDWDYICMIIDRDKGNVKSSQYEKILEKCREKSIRLFVSNPTFEFWLLLHSTRIFEYDPMELLANPKEGKKRYLEKTLSDVFEGYRKEYIKFDRFMPYIRTAIANEKKFCENVFELKDKLGSNVGELLSECILKE
ncbi:MAG: RloB family protein, partial [Clostridia bacterium]|nr:RloB family protein [Clostridia bacterium]